MQPFRLLAHRGASVRAPENSRSAFRAALESGSTEIETDVQMTTDGVLVLCHDDKLTRYGHGNRRVEECRYDELASLDFGSWFSPDFSGERIFRLDAFLSEFGSRFLSHIEIKGAHPMLAPATFDLVNQCGLWERVFYTSFSWEQLVRARAASAEARLGWLVKTIDDEVLQKAAELRLCQICPKSENLTEEAVCRARAIVPEVRAWGCPRNEEGARTTVARLQKLGCCGVTIDEPLWIEPEFRS